jgi:exonuclease VII small subunit
MSFAKFWLDEGWYTVDDLEEKLTEYKKAVEEVEKRHSTHLTQAMGEVKELLKKARDK